MDCGDCIRCFLHTGNRWQIAHDRSGSESRRGDWVDLLAEACLSDKVLEALCER